MKRVSGDYNVNEWLQSPQRLFFLTVVTNSQRIIDKKYFFNWLFIKFGIFVTTFKWFTKYDLDKQTRRRTQNISEIMEWCKLFIFLLSMRSIWSIKLCHNSCYMIWCIEYFFKKWKIISSLVNVCLPYFSIR